MTDIVMVWTTVPGLEVGRSLARTLVEERLAACVSLSSPMESTYRWNEAVTTDEERQLVIKTTADRVAALQARLVALHPYEVPEVLVCPVLDGWPRYLGWVRSATTVA